MKYLVLPVILFLFSGCQSRVHYRTYSNDTTQFYSPAHFIETEIRDVNATPYFIYKTTRHGNHVDSLPVSQAAFNQYAKAFQSVDITAPAVKKYYKESVFHDAATSSIIFTYSTDNPELAVQSEIILLDEAGQHVKRLFITRKNTGSDSTVFEKLSWKANESFSISRIAEKNGKEVVDETSITWNVKNIQP